MSLTPQEQGCLAAFREGQPHDASAKNPDWIAFGLRWCLEVGREIRACRFGIPSSDVRFKGDGSPNTMLEHLVEGALRGALKQFASEPVVVGEETGGTLPDKGTAIAIDPIDGTWSFLTGTETFTTTLAVFQEGRPIVGFVLNPTTGEIAYGSVSGTARLVQLSVFGEADTAFTLPPDGTEPAKILVNMQPSRTSASVMESLYAAWGKREIEMVRSPGGSPCWALLEAARGRYTYVNVWSDTPVDPWDLVAGTLIVRAAGGEVADLSGRPIDVLGHRGPFVAAIHSASRQQVSELVRKVLQRKE